MIKTSHATSHKENQQSKNEHARECSECNGDIIPEHSNGELVCEDCGLIIDTNTIDRGPEWRSFGDEPKGETLSRVGPRVTELLHDNGVSSEISWANKDGHGNILSQKRRTQMQRLRKWDSWAHFDGRERLVAYANNEIRRMGSALGVPRAIQETSAMLYKQTQEKELVVGRDVDDISAGCLYIAARVHDQPRPLAEVTSVSRKQRRDIARASNLVMKELGLQLEPVNPVKYVEKIANNVNADRDIITTAETILKEIDDTHISGHKPSAVAASAVYAAGIVHENIIPQPLICEHADVTRETIKKTYQLLFEHTDIVDLSTIDLSSKHAPYRIRDEINT